MAVAAIVLLAMGLLGAAATFFGFRHFQPARTAELLVPSPNPETTSSSNMGDAVMGEALMGKEERRVPPRAEREARTRITLEIEASQPSTGNQIAALYAQVMIDDEPYRDFVIRFTGANTFARWKRIETIVLDDVPASAREMTLVVATDPGLNDERMEGSTSLRILSEATSLSAAVRFYNQYDKSVKFR